MSIINSTNSMMIKYASNRKANEMDNKIKYILLIEDNKSVKEALSWLVESEGYNIETKSNGKTALMFLNSASILPRLILLDLMMPVMDGLAFRKVQANHPKISAIPTVIMSASDEINKIKKQTNEYLLIKPLAIEELFSIIKRYC